VPRQLISYQHVNIEGQLVWGRRTCVLLSSTPGVPMANVSGVIEQLKTERERVHNEVAHIDAALAALGSSSKRTVSVASRRKMAAALLTTACKLSDTLP
jgi:hypothetical protein